MEAGSENRDAAALITYHCSWLMSLGTSDVITIEGFPGEVGVVGHVALSASQADPN